MTPIDNMADYNKFYRIAYEFHKKWFPFPKNTIYWEKSIDDIRELCIMNGDNPFLEDILVNVLEEMQRNYQARLSPRK